MTRNKSVLIMAECAVMVALATVLSLISFGFPQGGSITLLSMLPILLVSYRRGVKVGVVTGFLYAVIQLLLGLKNLSYLPTAFGVVLCILLDYILPFSAIGLGGMFRSVRLSKNETANRVLTLILGAVIVILFRYLCHILSGVVIWYALDREWYADDPAHMVFRYGAWAFSVIYNGSFMIPELVLTTAGAAAVGSVKQIAQPVQS